MGSSVMNLFMPLEIGLWGGGTHSGRVYFQSNHLYLRKLGANQSGNLTNAFRKRQKSTKSVLIRHVWSAATQTERFLVPRGNAGAVQHSSSCKLELGCHHT